MSGSVSQSRRIFVVLDPTCMEQAALEWAEQIALEFKAHRSEDSVLHIYCCINEASVALAPGTNAEGSIHATRERVTAWVARLAAHSRTLGIDLETEIEWNPDWRKAIAAAVVRAGSRLVVKNMSQHAKVVRLVRETADWRLIGDCECPVLLVKTGRPYAVKQLLVAIKHQPEDAAHELANGRILSTARRIAEELGAKLHAVACYESTSHPDRQRFADYCGLNRNQVTAAEGVPEKVIAQTAVEVKADLLIIARVAESKSGKWRGDTARRLIDEIDTDVLILPMSD